MLNAVGGWVWLSLFIMINQDVDNIYDEQKLQYRIGALSGGIASIKVGAATETELKDKKLR